MHFKAFCLPVLLLAVLALAGCNGKVAVINTDKAFQESNAGKAGMTYLENLSKELQGELISLQDETKTTRNKEAAQAKLQQHVRDAQQRFGAEQQQVMNKISALYQQAMESYRNKSRIDVIMGTDAALSYSPKADITPKVIEEMNRTSLSFTPLDAQPEANGNGSKK